MERDTDLAALTGALVVYTLAEAKSALAQPGLKTLDTSGVERLDTSGALFLCGLRDAGVQLTGTRAEHARLLDLVCRLDVEPLPDPARVARARQFVMDIGKGADEFYRDSVDVVAFVGLAAEATLRSLVRPRFLRVAAISRQVEETGVNALPIIALMAVMISIVIGYQGVAQLRPYGARS